MNEDAAAFAAFVRANSRSLYGTAYLLTGNRDAAEELVQDTLVRLHPKWARVAAAESPLAYVRRVLINGFVSRQRRAVSRDIREWIATWNDNPRPFTWTKTADEILNSLADYLAKVGTGPPVTE